MVKSERRDKKILDSEERYHREREMILGFVIKKSLIVISFCEFFWQIQVQSYFLENTFSGQEK